MYGWAGRLKQFFTLQDREYVLLCPQLGEGFGLLHLTCQQGADCWCLQDCISEQTAEKFPAWAALSIAKRGWQNIPLLYVVPATEIMGYMMNLPPQLAEQERREAAYWEFDARLGERGLGAEAFMLSCQPVPGQENCAYVAAVRREYLQDVQAELAAEELELADMLLTGGQGKTAWDGGWQAGAQRLELAAALGLTAAQVTALEPVAAAVLNYIGSCGQKLPGLLGRRRERLSLSKIALVYGACLLTLGGSVLAGDVYHYQQAGSLLAQYQGELAGLAAEAQEAADWQNGQANVAAKDKLLGKLGQGQVPGYALLLHLGLDTCEGVYITELSSAQADSIQLSGRAVTYDALADYMNRLTEDKDFFAGSVQLESAAEEQAGQRKNTVDIVFKLRVALRGEAHEQKLADKN